MENKAKSFFKNAKNAFVRATDQNDDGKFTKEDISAFADSIGQSVKNKKQEMKENSEEHARQNDLKKLKPFFLDTMDDADFFISKFFHIADRDKKYIDSDVCKGSVGYFSDQKGFRYISAFRDSLDNFGLTFYPDSSSEFYYVDPTDRDRYIALDEYFSYLKIERVNELQMLAKSLGAKHFKVTYIEEQTSVSEQTKSGKIGGFIAADGVSSSQSNKYSSVNIAAEMECVGHNPTMPELKYLKKDPSVQALVSMRMDKDDPILHQKFMIKMSNSSGIKESDAVMIDAVLKGLKVSGNGNFAKEAKNELHRYLDYEIDF